MTDGSPEQATHEAAAMHHADPHASLHAGHEEEEPLGPIDWRAWGAAIVGSAVALLVAALLWLVSYA